jgi:hypothetical protein
LFSCFHPYFLAVTLIFWLSPLFSGCHPDFLAVALIFWLSTLFSGCHPYFLAVTLIFWPSMFHILFNFRLHPATVSCSVYPARGEAAAVAAAVEAAVAD